MVASDELIGVEVCQNWSNSDQAYEDFHAQDNHSLTHHDTPIPS